MASRRLDVNEALEVILNNFGLSDGSFSEEEGENIYAYIEEPIASTL